MKPAMRTGEGNKPGAYEATLHALANAEVPEGLETRVDEALQAALRAEQRQARILEWPGAFGWLRAAAAAAIVFVVAGGGWGVYRHAQNQAARTSSQPAPVEDPAGGFSSAGARRTPQTLKGPAAETVKTPAAGAAGSTSAHAVQPKTKRKADDGAAPPAAIEPGR